MATDVTVTVAAVARTAVRRVDGELARWNPVALAGVVGREALERAGLDASELDEVVVGCADPVGACGADAARAIVLAAGWPVSVGGHVIDRGETSGTAAVQAAATAVGAGQARTVLVIGLGLCSTVPPGAAALNRTYGAPWGGVAERFADRGGLLPAPRLSERAALAADLDRAALEATAEDSRRRRSAAGTIASIVAVAAKPGGGAGPGVYRGDPVVADVVRDWGDASELPPAFDDDGLLTAATFAPPADAVAALLLRAEAAGAATDSATDSAFTPTTGAATDSATDSAFTPTTGAATAAVPASAFTPTTGDATAAVPVAPLATVAGMGRAAGDPFDPTGDASAAVGRALADAGLRIGDVDEIAVVEHDAASTLLVARALGIDPARINRNGGAVATGNAASAEELRLIADGLACESASAGAHLLTISAGPTGSAAIVWRRFPR